MPSTRNFMIFICLFLSLLVPSTQLEYVISLPVNQEQSKFLKEKLLDISNPISNNWRNYMSMEEIRNLSKPSEEIRKPVIDWLESFSVTCSDFGDSFKCNSSTDVAAEMWNLNMSPKTGKLSGEVNIPEKLQNNILFVEGLYQKKNIKKLPNFKEST